MSEKRACSSFPVNRLTMHVDVTRCVTDVVWFTSRLGQGLGFQFWMTVMGAVLASSVTVFIRNR
jgi:hypothetical protein